VNALRKVHKALVPGGVLLDMHPVPPSARAEVDGRSLGEFEDAEFFGIVTATENLLATSGLFEPEAELHFDWLERYDSGDELLEDVKSWESCRVPRALAARIRKAEPPVDVWERVVLRRFSRSRG
jgi:hypothetical protein